MHSKTKSQIMHEGSCDVELQRNLVIEVDPLRNSAPAMRNFPAIQGQTQCKSEEDDGYCSRSSLDSPVQTLQSDSEANDQEVFVSKTVSTAAAEKTDNIAWNANTVGHTPKFSNSTILPSSIVSSPGFSAPHSGGHQKILIVNKASNAKCILPTTGTILTPLNVLSTTLAPPSNSAPSTKRVQSSPNLLNLKILKLDSKRTRPEQTTALGSEEKDGAGTLTIPTFSISSDAASVKSSCGASIGNMSGAVKASDEGLYNSGDDSVCINSTPCDGISETTLKNTNPSSKAVVVASQQRNEVIIPDKDNDDVRVDEPMLAAASLSQEVDVTPISGDVPTEMFSSEACASVGGSIGEWDTGVDQTADVTAAHNAICHSPVVLATENASLLSSRDAGTGNGNRESGALGIDTSQNAGKPCALSSSESGHGRTTATGGHSESSTKSGSFPLSSCASQDVTVILVPQNSVQSTTKKCNVTSDARCKQVLLRTGQGQLFKAIGVDSGSFKTVSPKITEKLILGNGDNTKLILNTVKGASVGKPSEEASKCVNCRDGSVINKISNDLGGSMLRENSASSCSQLQNSEKGLTQMARSSTNIGHFASLTLPGLQMAGGLKPNAHFVGNTKPLAPSSLTTTVSELPKNPKAVVEAVNPRVKVAEASNSSCRSRISVLSAQKLCHSMTSLHPLIDHDYCEFASFCADIQSSIISLTESSIRPERRYVKKNRAARTKAMRVSQYASESGATENRPKRKYCKRKHVVNGGSNKKYCASNCKLKKSGKVSANQSKGTGGTIKDGSQSTADDKDYVKIPGYYQDEYVYYATKRLPGRPRNRAEAASKVTETVVAKQPVSSSGISVFDWYKEMAQTDKTTRFGSDCNVHGSELLEESGSGKDCTPANESDVADLVMDMLPNGDLARPISDEMKYVSTSIVESLLSNSYDLSALSTLGGELSVDGNADMNLMAEEVRMMLSSMGEAELKLLESHLENEKIDDVDGLDINSYLGDYVAHENNMSQSSASNFLDVDINDGDLLSTDITNMNMNIILNDLKSSNHQIASQEGTVAKPETSGITSLFDRSVDASDDIMNGVHDIRLAFAKNDELSRIQNNEKIPNLGISVASGLLISESTRRNALAMSETSPPELTTINMFWNDLPGLLMNGKEYVRLVDIHKQIMPAKDTGILKKRCHMMGLHITNCSELQRDFLIRYMNAAKSKSTVIIAKDDAIMLIGFYVNPKSRPKVSGDSELDLLTPPLKQEKFVPKHGEKLPQPFDGKQKDKVFESESVRNLSPTGFLPEKVPVATLVSKNDSPHLLVPLVAENCVNSIVKGAGVKRSERLRHKHISYSDMVHGGQDESERAVKLERSANAKSLTNDISSGTVVTGTKSGVATGSKSNAVLATGHLVSEQEEMENLVREQKRRRLSLEEKLRLKLLRNSRRSSVPRPKTSTDLGLRKTRKRVIKRTKRTRRLLAWKRNQAVQKGPSGDLHTLEHCYAALPAHSTSSSNKHSHFIKQNSDHHITRNGNGTQGAESPEIVTPPAPSEVKISGSTSTESKLITVGVIHRGVACRVNRRRRSQVGELVPDLYTSGDAPCIRCGNCRELLTVADFATHMHWRHGSKKLVQIKAAQKLQLRNSSQMPESVAAWEAFQKKRASFESAPQTDETAVPVRKEKSSKTTPDPTNVKNADLPSVVPSTRHSSRVLKRRHSTSVEKQSFIKGQSEAEVAASCPDQKKHIIETEKPSLVTFDHHSPAAPTVQNLSNRVHQAKKFPLSNGNKTRPASRHRRPIVQSDRWLRATTRRSLDS